MTFETFINQIKFNLPFLIKILSETDITKIEIINLLKIFSEIQHEKREIESYEKFLKRTINYIPEKEKDKQSAIYKENIYICKEKVKNLEKEFIDNIGKIQNRNSNKTSLYYRLGEIQNQVKEKMRSRKK